MKQKIELYILSLWLLFVLLFINKINITICFSDCEFIGFKNLLEQNIIPAISLVFIVLGIVFYSKFKYDVVQGAPGLPNRIAELENINWEHLTFLVTYIIPLVSFDLDFNLNEDRNTLMFFLVLLIIGWIYVKTNMFYTNPTLALLGYHIYKLRVDNSEHKIILISKEVLRVTDWIRYKHISDNIYFGIKSNEL